MNNSKQTLISIGIAVSLMTAMASPIHAQVIAKPSSAGAGRGHVNPKSDSPPQGADKLTIESDDQFGGGLPKLPVVAQPPKLPAVAAMPSYKTPIDTDSAINPLTGKSFSEERLTRLLNANKLVTDIARQQVAQAQLQTELELTGDRRQAESAKIRSEAINIIPKLQVPAKDSLKTGEELVSGSNKRASSFDLSKMLPKPESGFQIPNAGLVQSTATGNIRIGTEMIPVQSTYSGSQSRVVYVDTQVAGSRANTGSNLPSSLGALPTFPNTAPSIGGTAGSFTPNFVPSPTQR